VAWWVTVIVFLLGLLILVLLVAVVLLRFARTRRELAWWEASVRRSTALLQAHDVGGKTNRGRNRAVDVGRIAPVPTKGE
jgi:uncharacterized protein HemY